VQWEREPERRPKRWTAPALVEQADPSPIIAEVFEAVGGPVRLDDLVALIAAVWRIGRSPSAVERAPYSSRENNPEAAIDSRRLVEQTWDEVRQLPIRQRVALLFNLRDTAGAGMLWIFAVTGVASIRTIAETLEISAEELAGLWKELPIDDATIAARLGCTRQQVINLRMSARKRLANRLCNIDSVEPKVDGQRGNVLSVSPSTRRST
jgi:hypothetical protein